MTILSQQAQEVLSTYSYLPWALLVFTHNSNSYLSVYSKFPAQTKNSELIPSFLLHFCTFLKVWASAPHHGSIPWQLNTAHTPPDKIYCKHLIQLLRFGNNTKLGLNIQSTNLLLDTQVLQVTMWHNPYKIWPALPIPSTYSASAHLPL